MELTVFLYGSLRQLVNHNEVKVNLPEGSTLQNLIDKLGEEFGEELRTALQPELNKGLPLTISIGPKDYRFYGGLAMRLEERIPVYFIPAAVGG
jgi:molybdopterin converting factor small subunit